MKSQFLTRNEKKQTFQAILTGDQFPTCHSPHGLKQLETSAGRGK